MALMLGKILRILALEGSSDLSWFCGDTDALLSEPKKA